MAADLSYPVLTRKVGGGLRELLDGSHRVAKSKQTGQPVREIIVPDALLRRAKARKEIEGKQYAPGLIDIEKLWKLTKDMPSKPLDTSKIRWRSMPIEFPKGEVKSLAARLNRGKPIYTTRVSAERGRYSSGMSVSSVLGDLKVTSVKHGVGVKTHPFLGELSPEHKKAIGNKPYDLVKMEKTAFLGFEDLPGRSGYEKHLRANLDVGKKWLREGKTTKGKIISLMHVLHGIVPHKLTSHETYGLGTEKKASFLGAFVDELDKISMTLEQARRASLIKKSSLIGRLGRLGSTHNKPLFDRIVAKHQTSKPDVQFDFKPTKAIEAGGILTDDIDTLRKRLSKKRAKLPMVISEGNVSTLLHELGHLEDWRKKPRKQIMQDLSRGGLRRIPTEMRADWNAMRLARKHVGLKQALKQIPLGLAGYGSYLGMK